MSLLRRVFFSAASLLVSVVVVQSVQAADLPHRGMIRYEVVRGDGGFEIGNATHEWKRDGRRYSLAATTRPSGIAALLKPVTLVQRSEGQWLSGALRPDSFAYDRGNGDIETARFDWTARNVVFRDGKNSALDDEAEDTLSMFYQLSLMPKRSEPLVMQVATGHKVERYQITWVEEELVELKAGRFETWRIRIVPVTGGDTTEVWLGKSVASLPVKIRFTDRKGGSIDQLATEIDYEGK